MTDKNYQNFTDYEKKIIEAMNEIREGQEMIIEGNKKIQDGKLKMSHGIDGMNNRIEELESKRLEKVVSSEPEEEIIKDVTVDVQPVIDDSHEKDEKVSKGVPYVKSKSKRRERTAAEIARDFDVFGGEFIDYEDEYEYVEVEPQPKPKGDKTKEVELLSRKDRNRIIIIFFIFGMFIAILRAVFEGWPIIVWPPYNSFLLHENSWFRCFVRWFVDILICEIILDFDITPLNDVDRSGGNINLYIPRAYRGKDAYMRLPGKYTETTGFPPDYF